jgi:predicted hydrocarbon binding protein
MEMADQLNCKNRLCQWMLQSLEETVGEEEIRLLAEGVENHEQNHSSGEGPFSDIRQVLSAMEKWFGQLGSKGLSIQAGRNAFNVLLQENGEELGWFSQRFRLLPKTKRIEEGLASLVKWLANLCGTSLRIEEDETNWCWIADDFAWQELGNDSLDMCFFSQGLLQEFMLWASGGRVHLVNVASCALDGDQTCMLQIKKQPMEG